MLSSLRHIIMCSTPTGRRSKTPKTDVRERRRGTSLNPPKGAAAWYCCNAIVIVGCSSYYPTTS